MTRLKEPPESGGMEEEGFQALLAKDQIGGRSQLASIILAWACNRKEVAGIGKSLSISLA
jgi:hypothetical protein